VAGRFEVISDFTPQGDQPAAIRSITEGLDAGLSHQVLLGATGTGKTFAVSKIIEQVQRPALVIAPNKILAAQLAGEFKEFFPANSVEFFISYYDYYQPEAYVPSRDLYIEKDSSINEELERLRHHATAALLTRRDVIVVASVSCIYGIGSPEHYSNMNLLINTGVGPGREETIEKLVAMQYERNEFELRPGRFRVKGEILEVWPAYEERLWRVEFFGDEPERIAAIDPVSGEVFGEEPGILVYPASHYVTPQDEIDQIIPLIEAELEQRYNFFKSQDKLLEAQRIRERTLYDLEMLRTMGACKGIENYSLYLTGRKTGEPPYTLLDYFPDDFVTFIDESHVAVPQIEGMFNGDWSRKMTLVDHGFRLPSALDNRPLKFAEFLGKVGQIVYTSATPADYERRMAGRIAEMVIRPTGLVDPEVIVKPAQGQIDDLLAACRARASRNERVLVTTLTKRMAEDLTEYLANQGVRVRYMHSEIDALERQVIIRDLRLGHFDVLVGINLLREGLDLPEVSLVAILDADKTGFLRSARSLIQTIGRAARNVEGKVFLYADSVSDAMRAAMDETNRRRDKQLAYNQEHGITPQSIRKRVREVIQSYEATAEAAAQRERLAPWERELQVDEIKAEMASVEQDMWAASEGLDFELAAQLRDRLRALEAQARGEALPALPTGLLPAGAPGSQPAKRRRARRR
jgi:excinuclease ABC subunit B